MIFMELITISFTSCKSDQYKKAEIVTNNYVRFIDSVTNINTNNAIKDWSSIQKDFEEKSNELNIEIDKLWLQMISGNNIFNDGIGSLSGDQQAVDMLGDEQDNYNLMNFDKLIGDTSPYDMLGDIPFYKER